MSYSTARFCPSIQPSSRNPRKMSMLGFGPEVSERKPIRAVLGGGCAAASGVQRAPASDDAGFGARSSYRAWGDSGFKGGDPGSTGG
jgi:hypothetical protein